MTSKIKNQYLKMYHSAHNNAVDLLAEAELLLKHKHFARAYALAYTAIEELSKSQFAADVFTGFSTDNEFKNSYRYHDKKIERIKWAHLESNSYPNNMTCVGPEKDDIILIYPSKPLFEKRQKALYVDFNPQSHNIDIPKEKIKEKDAREIIHIVRVALDQIFLITEYHGHQIGTKGFMK